MATSPKIHSSNNDREQTKDELQNELTEKLKNGVNTHVISELCERLDALKKSSGFDSLNQITAIREQFEALNKANGLDTQSRIAAIKEQFDNIHKISQLNISLDALNKTVSLDTLNKITAMKEQFDALHKTSAISIALDSLNKASELDSRKKIAEIMAQQNTLKEITSKAFLSFNLYPLKTFESSLRKINYPNSIERALARDWQNVGNDLWNSYLKVSNKQLSDNNE